MYRFNIIFKKHLTENSLPDDAVLAGVGLEDVLVHGQHGDDDLGVCGHLGDAPGALGPSPHDVVHGLLVDVVDRELVALLHEVLGHEAAHVAQADEPDIGKVSLRRGREAPGGEHFCRRGGVSVPTAGNREERGKSRVRARLTYICKPVRLDAPRKPKPN